MNNPSQKSSLPVADLYVLAVRFALTDAERAAIDPGDAPGNYTKPETIAAWKAKRVAEIESDPASTLFVGHPEAVAISAVIGGRGTTLTWRRPEDILNGALPELEAVLRAHRVVLLGLNTPEHMVALAAWAVTQRAYPSILMCRQPSVSLYASPLVADIVDLFVRSGRSTGERNEFRKRMGLDMQFPTVEDEVDAVTLAAIKFGLCTWAKSRKE